MCLCVYAYGRSLLFIDCILKFQCLLHDQSKSLLSSLKSKETWDRVKLPFPTKKISTSGPNPWINVIWSCSKLNPACLITDLKYYFLQESPSQIFPILSQGWVKCKTMLVKMPISNKKGTELKIWKASTGITTFVEVAFPWQS